MSSKQTSLDNYLIKYRALKNAGKKLLNLYSAKIKISNNLTNLIHGFKDEEAG